MILQYFIYPLKIDIATTPLFITLLVRLAAPLFRKNWAGDRNTRKSTVKIGESCNFGFFHMLQNFKRLLLEFVKIIFAQIKQDINFYKFFFFCVKFFLLRKDLFLVQGIMWFPYFWTYVQLQAHGARQPPNLIEVRGWGGAFKQEDNIHE